MWPALSDSLLRHRTRNGRNQFGAEGRGTVESLLGEGNRGSYGPELLGEGSPAHWIKRNMEGTKSPASFSSPPQATSIWTESQDQEEKTHEDQFIWLALWRRIRSTRGCVEEVRRLQNRHLYIGRGKTSIGGGSLSLGQSVQGLDRVANKGIGQIRRICSSRSFFDKSDTKAGRQDPCLSLSRR